MAITYGTHTSLGNGTTATITVTGSAPCLIVSVCGGGTGGSICWNLAGSLYPFTLGTSAAQGAAAGTSAVYYLANPRAGAGTVHFYYSPLWQGVSLWNGVDQVIPYKSFGSNTTGASTQSIITLTGNPGDIAVDAQSSSVNTLSPDGTSLTTGAGRGYQYRGIVSGSTSVQMRWSGSSQAIAHAAVLLRPAQLGVQPVSVTPYLQV